MCVRRGLGAGFLLFIIFNALSLLLMRKYVLIGNQNSSSFENKLYSIR